MPRFRKTGTRSNERVFNLPLNHTASLPLNQTASSPLNSIRFETIKAYLMFTVPINNVLTILALTVFADKRVFADEINSFINSARNLESLTDKDQSISPPKLLAWFEVNRDELKARMQHGKSFEMWLNNLLDALSDHPDRHAILNRMIKISKADGEVHVSEKALLALTARRWRIKLAA